MKNGKTTTLVCKVGPCHNILKTGGLERTEIYSLVVREARSLESRGQQGWFLLKPREGICPTPLPAPGAVSDPRWSRACRHLTLLLSSHPLVSCVPLFQISLCLLSICTYNTIFFLRFCLFIFRQRGREGEKHQGVVASRAPPAAGLARNPSMCPDWESNRRFFGLQTSAQSTEPHQAGHNTNFLIALGAYIYSIFSRSKLHFSNPNKCQGYKTTISFVKFSLRVNRAAY